MPNRKKRKTGSTAETEAAARAGRRGKILVGVVLAAAVAGGAFVGWHRQRDPARRWARAVEQAHARKIEQRLTRCFGGADGAAVRRAIPAVRGGSLPAPLRTCRGPVLTELAASPMDFAADLLEAPGAAENARTRERDQLERLRGSLAQLERALAPVGTDGAVPEDRRGTLVTALEDVAVDVDAERTSLGDLLRAAEEAASIW